MKEATTHLPEACPQWAEHLNAVHHDDLPFEQRLALRKHLETCPNCQAVKAEYRAMDALITSLPEVEPLACLPARLQELLGVYEEDELLQVQDDLAAKISSSTADGHVPAARSHPHRRRGSILAKKLNLVAAVLVVVTILGGFLALSAVQRSNSANASRAAIYTLTPALREGTPVNLLSALNPRDHSLIWQRILGLRISVPALATDGHIYYSSPDGNVYALSASDGAPLWHTRITPDETAFTPVQFGSILQAHGDLLFVSTTSGDLYGLKGSTGAIVWSRHFQGCTADDKWGTPLTDNQTHNATFSGNIVGCDVILDDQANGVLYGHISYLHGGAFNMGSGQHAVVDESDAWNEANGQTIWSLPASPFSAVATAHNKLYTRTSDGIDVLNAKDGSFLHSLKRSSKSQVVQVTANANVLYFTDENNMLSAYSLSDDTLLWQKQLAPPGAMLSVTNRILYVLESNGSAPGQTTDLYALHANTGTQIWHWHGSETGANPPIEMNGVLYLDTIDGLYAFQSSNGHPLWKLPEPYFSDAFSDTTM